MSAGGAEVHPLLRPWAAGWNPRGLTELDVASGVVLGDEEAEPWDATEDDPLVALEGVSRDLLGRGRCVVAFSGGRDSSALLAVLLRVARREGFDDPVALTARWPGDAASDEREWQDHVAATLGVRSWEIVTPGTDVDLLGPLSTALLREHGLLWPAPVASLMPMIEAAGDGILVTGEGGDEVFDTWSLARAWTQLRRGRPLRVRSLGRAVRRLAGASLPTSLRVRHALRSVEPYQRWLRPEAHRRHCEALALDGCDALFWPDHLREVAGARGLRMNEKTVSTLCATRGGTFFRPLLAPAFLAALARRGGRAGLGDRTEAMTAVFGPVLDQKILTRRSKATFGSVLWGPGARAFAQDWDGEGVDHRWVDVEALRAAWKEEPPVYACALPLQAAWLAQDRSRQAGSSVSSP